MGKQKMRYEKVTSRRVDLCRDGVPQAFQASGGFQPTPSSHGSSVSPLLAVSGEKAFSHACKLSLLPSTSGSSSTSRFSLRPSIFASSISNIRTISEKAEEANRAGRCPLITRIRAEFAGERIPGVVDWTLGLDLPQTLTPSSRIPRYLRYASMKEV